MKLSHFQFDLPKIAGRIPSEHRDEARLIVDRKTNYRT
jgi:S-adenosylmethionine:tRNA-ribosyltransferase-isomerase (queuine synthetase)